MPITASCPRCDYTITANDEDELVTKVEAHVRDDHGLTHEMPRKHVLAMLKHQDATPS
jgi:predicted small metal-binding protein